MFLLPIRRVSNGHLALQFIKLRQVTLTVERT
ncbi:hypothetical protein PATA110615_26075 [Paenibacillus taichungensis]